MADKKERRNKSKIEKYAVSVLATLSAALIIGLITTYVDVQRQKIIIENIGKQIEEVKDDNKENHKALWERLNNHKHN